MPYSEKKIRLLALGIIRQENNIFMSQGFDPIKEKTFYRAMGGGVKFGETSIEALKREFKEEINAEINNINHLGCIESIFTYNGKPGHEIIQLYQCDFVDQKLYEIERITFNEGKREKIALWVNINQFKSGELRIVPEQFLDYL